MTTPIQLGQGPRLFIDDYLIAESTGLTRTTHRPEKLPEPVIKCDGADHPVFYVKVDRDPENGLFRVWYNSIRVSGPGPSHQYDISHRYRESTDGIHWGESQVVSTPHSGLDFSLFLVDKGADSPNPSERYRLGVYYAGKGLWVSHSSDGLNFTDYPDNPVIPTSFDDTPADSPDYKNVIGDIIDGCWDPLKKEYLLGCGVGENGYPGKAPRNFPSRRRCVGMSASKDFVNWEIPRIIVRPDPNNGLEEFYGFKPMVRGDLYIGFLRVLHDDWTALPGVPEAGVGWTELITSRDGKTWTRYQERFLDPDPTPGAYDHAMAWFGDCVQVGDKEYIYYGGYTEGHKRGDRQMGLGLLRRDGFVSRDAGDTEGLLRTPALALKGDGITVNAKVSGELRVRVTDPDGAPLPGFDWSDYASIAGDSLAHPLVWKGGTMPTTNKPVRLEFSLRQAELYGFDVGIDRTASPE